MATRLQVTRQQNNTFGDANTYDLDFAVNRQFNSALTVVTTTTSGGTEIQATYSAGGSNIQFVTPLIAEDVTLTSIVTYLRCAESASGVNCSVRARWYKVAIDGVTITEIGGGPFDFGTELTTSAAGKSITCNITDTALVVGERLLLRVFWYNIGTMGSGTATLYTSYRNACYVDFAETIKFKEPRKSFDFLQGSDTKHLYHFNGTGEDNSGLLSHLNVLGNTLPFTSNVDKFKGITASNNGLNLTCYAATQNISGTGAFTIDFDFMPENANSSDGAIFFIGNKTTNLLGLKASSLMISSVLHFYIKIPTTIAIDYTIPANNVKYKVTITYDGTTLLLYFNGVQVGTSTVALNISNFEFDIIGVETSTGVNMQGKLDEFIVENVCWSASKIKKIMTYQRGRYAII